MAAPTAAASRWSRWGEPVVRVLAGHVVRALLSAYLPVPLDWLPFG